MELHKEHWLALGLPRPDPIWMEKICQAVRDSDKKNPHYSRSRVKFFLLLDGRTPKGFNKRPRLALASLLIHWSRKTGLNLEEERRVVLWGIVNAGWAPAHGPECMKSLVAVYAHARETYVDYTLQKSMGRPDKSHLRARALLEVVKCCKAMQASFSTADAVNELWAMEPTHNWRSFQVIIGRFLLSSVSRGWLIKVSRGRWSFIVDSIPDHKNPSRKLQRQQRQAVGGRG